MLVTATKNNSSSNNNNNNNNNNNSIFYLLCSDLYVWNDVMSALGLCGNWIEIAYGTSSGTVRVIVQHPETVGHGPQLFQTFTVHQSPVTKVRCHYFRPL
jgi:hypothetical protein